MRKNWIINNRKKIIVIICILLSVEAISFLIPNMLYNKAKPDVETIISEVNKLLPSNYFNGNRLTFKSHHNNLTKGNGISEFVLGDQIIEVYWIQNDGTIKIIMIKEFESKQILYDKNTP